MEGMKTGHFPFQITFIKRTKINAEKTYLKKNINRAAVMQNRRTYKEKKKEGQVKNHTNNCI